MRNRRLCWPVAIALTAILVGCSFGKTPSQPVRMSQPATISATGPPPLTTAIALPFEPMSLRFRASANKLYASGIEGGTARGAPPPRWREYVVSLSAPTGPIERFDTSIEGLQQDIVVNDKLRRGYALMMSGDLKVFSTDSDTLVSTAQKPSCYLQVLAINQATGMVYGGGGSDKGGCIVQFDSDGQVVREKVVAASVKGKSPDVGPMLVDSASGDVLYKDALGVARVDQMLKEKWRTPVNGPGEPMDMGFEPKTNTAYVEVGADPVISPSRIYAFDAGTGKPKGEFSGPGRCQGFADTGDGRLFVIFFNSTDLYVLSDGASTLTKFGSLSDIPGWAPSDTRWLEVDKAGRRLFVSPGGDRRKIAIYQY
jgi:hypothetical protein